MLDGLDGRCDCGELGDFEDPGDVGGVGNVLGVAFTVSTGGTVGIPTVRTEAPSSSSNSDTPDNVELLSEYEFRIEETRVEDEVEVDKVDKRIVSESESVLELILILIEEMVEDEDMEQRKEDIDDAVSDAVIDDALSESELEVASPMSCLCVLQCMSGIAVNFTRILRSTSRTSLALGRRLGAVLSIFLIRVKICGTARKASSSGSKEASSIIFIQVSIFSRLAWNEESVREFFPPKFIFCFEDRCFVNSCGFFFIMKVKISKKIQPRENTSAFSVS